MIYFLKMHYYFHCIIKYNFSAEAEENKGLIKSLLIKNTEPSSEVNFLRNELRGKTFYLEL